MRASDHEDDSFVFVDLVKESSRADPVTPRLGRVVPELPHMSSEVWIAAQLWIDDLPELLEH